MGGSVGNSDWYDEFIEEGVRDVVRLLRANGYNTTCSCHHDMTIQGQYWPGVDLLRLHALLWDHLAEADGDVTFTLTVHHIVNKCSWGESYWEIGLNRPKVERGVAVVNACHG